MRIFVCHAYTYSIILVTTPAPTVRTPSGWRTWNPAQAPPARSTHRQVDIVARHHHPTPSGRVCCPSHPSCGCRTAVDTTEECLVSPTFFLLQHIHLRQKLLCGVTLPGLANTCPRSTSHVRCRAAGCLHCLRLSLRPVPCGTFPCP